MPDAALRAGDQAMDQTAPILPATTPRGRHVQRERGFSTAQPLCRPRRGSQGRFHGRGELMGGRGCRLVFSGGMTESHL